MHSTGLVSRRTGLRGSTCSKSVAVCVHLVSGTKCIILISILGAGAVTQLYAKSFNSVHAIDVSPSMLATFSSELPASEYPNVTHSLHTLSATSGTEFQSGKPVKSPTKAETEREIGLPRTQWDVALINLVLHHVDDIEGFMKGLKDLVRPGGWVVFTEFTNLHQHRKVSPDLSHPSISYVATLTQSKETAEGSVNAPHHYHQEFTQESITALLGHCGFGDVHTEVRGKMSIPREANFFDVDCLIARARKPE